MERGELEITIHLRVLAKRRREENLCKSIVTKTTTAQNLPKAVNELMDAPWSEQKLRSDA